eukprot:GAHX01003129.1.p1 GENE.GAHX01003129.1~~GAHX01003129.1.p1  ORF type:complete len:397 (-),score=75.33 GAHX01003129.1:33-1223(-)
MPNFQISKKNIIPHKTKRPTKPQSHWKFYTILTFILIYFICLFISIYKSFSTKHEIPTSTKITNKAHLKVIEATTISSTIEGLPLSLQFINASITSIRSLNDKLYQNNDPLFQKVFLSSVFKLHPKISAHTKDINKLSERLNIILNAEIPHERLNDVSFYNTKQYYKALFIYYKLHSKVKEIFYWNEFTILLNEEKNNKTTKYYNERFIYQQTYLKLLIESIIKAQKKFKSIYNEKLNILMKEQTFVEIGEYIVQAFNKLKEIMFVQFEGEFCFKNYGRNIKVNYIMENFSVLRKFVVLNLCFVYLHIFDFDIRFKAFGFNKHAKQVLTELYTAEEEINLSYGNVVSFPNPYTDECDGVLNNVSMLNTANEKVFWDGLLENITTCDKKLFSAFSVV